MELANAVIKESMEFIDVENQFIKQEHLFSDALFGWHNLIMELYESCSSEEERDFILLLIEKISEITDLIESDRLKDMQFVKEEEAIAEKLEEDIKHRDWRAVRIDIALEKREEKKVVRLEERELKEIHSKLLEILVLVKQRKIKDPQLEHYISQLESIFKTYEEILRNLIEKEKEIKI